MIYIDPSNNKFFHRFAKYIQYEMFPGQETEITNDYTKKGLWVLTYASFVNRVHDVIVPNGCEYIAFQTEPEEKFKKTGYREFINAAKKAYYYHQNFQCGYSDYWRLEMEEAKDIDVYHYGTLNVLREEVLNKIPNVTIDKEIWGDDLLRKLMRCKIVLSIRHYANNNTDWERISALVPNKIFIIGERYQDESLNKICDHAGIVLGERDQIPSLVKHYLANPIERLQRVDSAFDYMKYHYATIFKNDNDIV